MATRTAYLATAQAYADGVHHLLAGGGPIGATPSPTTDVVREMVATPDLADRAVRLLSLADALTQAASGMLNDGDPVVRAQGETTLLATALTDLLVGLHLYEVARGEPGPSLRDALEQARNLEAGSTRSAAIPEWKPFLRDWAQSLGDWEPSRSDIENTLQVLLAEPSGVPTPAGDAGGTALEVNAARFQLAGAVVDTILTIRSQTVKAGQTALNGLLGVGAGEVAEAAGMVGLNVARVFGQTDKATQIYDLFREFAFRSYDALLALLGTHMAEATADQMVAWLAQLRSGEELARLLERTYGTAQLGAALGDLMASSQASPAKFTSATLALASLCTAYATQTKLVRQLLRGLVLFGIAPATFLPQGGLVLLAAFLVLTGYIVLAGADFLDAPAYEPLDRVPGVRHIVEQALS